MGEYVRSSEILKTLKGQVLGGAKTPHSTSFPVLRMVNGSLCLAFYLQFNNREQMEKKLLQRPSYWYLADLKDGRLLREIDCHKEDFCSAPFDRLYRKGEAVRKGTREDVAALYEMLDEIRLHYLRDGVIDAFVYGDYLKLLFEILPAGQINFYKELTKLK